MKTLKQLIRTMLFVCITVVLLEVHTSAVNVTDVSFDFANNIESFGYPDDYRISLERYVYIFGNNPTAKQYYAANFIREGEGWIGNSFGLAAAAGLLYHSDNDINPRSFRKGANSIGQLRISDKNEASDITLLEFIEAMQISQYADIYQSSFKAYMNRVQDIYSLVSRSGNELPIICVYGPIGSNGVAGQSLLAYRIDRTSDRIYVYDPNYPNDENKYIQLELDDSGNYVAWHYQFSHSVIWGSEMESSGISCIPYFIYAEVWKNRGNISFSDYQDILKDSSIEQTPSPILAPFNSDITKYSYSFANSGADFDYPPKYRFDPKRFQYVYGEEYSKKMNQVDFCNSTYWSGNCYGISTTAAMLSRPGSGITPSDFRDGAEYPSDLLLSDINDKLGLTLTQFIEAMQISQYSSTFAATRKQNRNQVSSLQSAMSAFEAGGFGPLVICIYGDDKYGNYCGHALLAYHLDGQYLYVYDCNHPNDGQRYITLTDDNWSYQIYDDLTWNSSNGEITYIQYETYLMDWYNRGRLLGDPDQLRQIMIFISSADATIADSQGREVAAFSKGKMVSGIDAAFPIPPLGVTADGASTSSPQIAVWLPLDSEYRVTSREDATVSMVNSVGESVNNAKAGQTVSVSLSGASFTDVSPGQYYYEPMQWAVGHGITNGTSATTFSPQNTCSRNHILTFLWRANGCRTASIHNPFTDISLDGDFGKAAVWAAENGLVSGTRFHGDDPCTRAEAVTFFWKLAGRPLMGRNSFTDVPSNADYAQAVSWAVSQGITKGTSESTFNPSDTCTRGQIMTFLYRAFVQ